MSKITYRIASGLFCLLACFLSTSILSPTASAYAANATVPSGTCLQAPATLDPTKLTSAQLRAYGFPDQHAPTAKGLSDWLRTIGQLKHDRHACTASLSASDRSWVTAHPHNSLVHSRAKNAAASQCNLAPPSNGQGCDALDQTGNWAIGPQNQYDYASTNYNLPCMTNTTTINNGQASFWIGLGGDAAGGDTGNGWLVQDGNEVHVDASGHVSYTGFYEATRGQNEDHLIRFSMPNAHCGNTMYIYVSDLGGDYYIIDGGGVNYTFIQSWPASDGMSSECVVERIFDLNHGYYLIFVDFNYMAFSNCEANSNPIGNVRHYYTSMIDNNNNVLAYPGPISNGGLNFHINWKQKGCTC